MVKKVETVWWESTLIRSTHAYYALVTLCKLAHIDPAQPREAWDRAETLLKVTLARRTLFAHLRKMRTERPRDMETSTHHQVVAWMLLVTGCSFGPAHCRELIDGIRRDPAYLLRSRYENLPATSSRYRRSEALLLLLTDLYQYDTSQYVSDRPTGWRALRQRWFGPRPNIELLPFLETQRS